jgi:cytochrome b
MATHVSKEVRVWDPAVRIFHGTLAAAFATAWLTGDELALVHVNAGYLIGGLLVFRLIWGFVGTRHARFSDFVRTPSQVLAYVRDAVRLRSGHYLGHNPAGGAMILALMITLGITVASGMALYGATDFAGPLAGMFRGELAADLLEGLHEAAANLTLFLVVLHLGGVFFSSLAEGENLIRAMITGRKERRTA